MGDVCGCAGVRERRGHPPVLLPIPQPSQKSYFGQGKQDGSHTPPPPLLPPSSLQEKPRGLAMPAWPWPTSACSPAGLPAAGNGLSSAAAPPRPPLPPPLPPPVTPRPVLGPDPAPGARRGRFRLLLSGGSGEEPQPRRRKEELFQRFLHRLHSVCFAPSPGCRSPGPELARSLAAQRPPSPAVCEPGRLCRAGGLAAGPGGPLLEPPLPNRSGTVDTSPLSSPRSTQPPCPSPVAVGRREAPRASPSRPPAWRRRPARQRGPWPPSAPARHGTPRRWRQLKAEVYEELGVSAQVEREARVLQSPSEAMSGAEAGARREPVRLAPEAAGAGTGPAACARRGGHAGRKSGLCAPSTLPRADLSQP